MKLYIVMGSTGAYSDYHKWTVCAYKSREMAKKHAEIAAYKIKKMFCEMKIFGIARGEVTEKLRENKWIWDPKISMDYTGVSYFVVKLELKEKLPSEN
jgi:hypothetical protein